VLSEEYTVQNEEMQEYYPDVGRHTENLEDSYDLSVSVEAFKVETE